MAELRPLRPLLYDPGVVPDLSAVLTPPYDVITPADARSFRERSPYSAIHLELPEDADGVGRYERAARLLGEWREAGALRPRDEPSFFVHTQEYALGGATLRRTALLAGVRLEPWDAGVVLAHQLAHRGPKRDRLDLLRATAVAPSSIFSLYEQPETVRRAIVEARRAPPLAQATEGGVAHRLWAMTAPAAIGAVRAAMAAVPLYIADGHHRYETALAYRDERRAAAGDAPDPERAYESVAMSLVAFDDPGLVVLPTHRLVLDVSADAVAGLDAALPSTFDLETLPADDRTEGGIARLLDVPAPYAFLLYDGRRLLRVTGGERVAVALPPERSAAWRALDLAALHELVLARALGLEPERVEEVVRYTRDVPGAFAAVDAGEARLAAFVRPTGVGQLRAVADAGDKMPQKSTYFYPKFPAGLVINRLDVRLPAPSAEGVAS